MKRIHMHKELKIPAITSRIKKLATTFHNQVATHHNSLINIQSLADIKRKFPPTHSNNPPKKKILINIPSPSDEKASSHHKPIIHPALPGSKVENETLHENVLKKNILEFIPVGKSKCTEGRCGKIIQAHLKENRVVITRELGDGGNIGDCHTFTDGQVDHRVSQVLVKMGRFQRSIKCETLLSQNLLMVWPATFCWTMGLQEACLAFRSPATRT
ncbi:hypothetical protein TNIN_50541 [Trichonephila inaurata madagascariensis]|uniref:Uncharacterized protein n=1 Tax=Trichonephila inaurata madagascariensis TaxID=2747483 RepID=A0A8X7CRX3_9ARAC|nr:hypothetical protein TNIN_50541 [Trichonephila inaurata madagascariensis]